MWEQANGSTDHTEPQFVRLHCEGGGSSPSKHKLLLLHG